METELTRIGCSGTTPTLECINPRRGVCAALLDYVTDPETGTTEGTEARFDHRPDPAEVRALRTEAINAATAERILSGMTWEGIPVWLSPEAQANIAAIERLGDDAPYPLRLKLGEADDGTPAYHTFPSAAAFLAFSRAVTTHILTTLQSGYTAKDTALPIP